MVSSVSEWKQALKQFPGLQPGERMELARVANVCTIHCISQNCYAIAQQINQAPVWHLFDRETLESLLITV